jgi:hypothetical protein
MASWLVDIGQGVDGMGLLNERQLVNRVHQSVNISYSLFDKDHMTLEPEHLTHISRHDQTLIQKRRREICKLSHSALRASMPDEPLD